MHKHLIPDPDTAAILRQAYSGNPATEAAVTAIEAFGLVDALTAARLLAVWPYLPSLSPREQSAVLAFFVDHEPTGDDIHTLVERALDAARQLPAEIADAIVVMAAVLLSDPATAHRVKFTATADDHFEWWCSCGTWGLQPTFPRAQEAAGIHCRAAGGAR